MSQSKVIGYVLMALGALVSLGASIFMAKAGEEDTRNAVNDYISEHRSEFIMEAKN
jgi:hypothetical protein